MESSEKTYLVVDYIGVCTLVQDCEAEALVEDIGGVRHLVPWEWCDEHVPTFAVKDDGSIGRVDMGAAMAAAEGGA
jgi:hypothetical protein